MTAVLLSSTSAIHTTYHHPRSESNQSNQSTTRTPRGGTHPGGGGAGALRREPLGAVDPNMSTRRQAKVVVDYNEAGSGKGKGGAGANGLSGTTGTRTTGKRKAVSYEEDIEGFQFSRATQQPKKSRPSPTAPEPEPVADDSTPPQPAPKQKGRGRPAKKNAATSKQQQQQRPATETRNGKVVEEEPGQRRSKRLADDDVSTTPMAKQNKTRRKVDTTKKAADEDEGKGEDHEDEVVTQAQPAETKIALPMADTPVIRKNKEMRQEKGKKASGGQRRSSLGMRGRRASSLIDSGVSNALPHDAVDAAHFYKHIEGEGLPEPRRMKQLLTWCATRALGKKPSGSRSEDESARLAARVIQEELLKDVGSRSELSDWFGREETTPPPVVVKKPNPKNVHNADKIKELEDHIQKLQAERQSLAALLKAPSIPRLTSPPPPSRDEQQTSQQAESSTASVKRESIDSSLLDPSQQSLLAILNGTSSSPPSSKESKSKRQQQHHLSNPSEEEQTQANNTATAPTAHPTAPATSIPVISSRLSSLALTPSLDSLAAGMHDVELYRRAADGFAGSILKICARRLEERDLAGRERSSRSVGENNNDDDDGGGGGGSAEKSTKALATMSREQEDLRVVLGALSRLER